MTLAATINGQAAVIELDREALIAALDGQGQRDGAQSATLVGKADLAARVGVSVATIKRWMAERVIPFRKVGGKVLFRVEEVLASLDQHKREARLLKGVR